MPWQKINPDNPSTDIQPMEKDRSPERIWDEHKRKYPEGNSAKPRIQPDMENFYDPDASKRGRIRQKSV